MMEFPEIARVFERKQALAAVAMAVVSEPIAEGFMAYAAPGSYANRASGFGLGRQVTEVELDRLVAFYESRGAEACAELSPFTPEDLLSSLAARGFVLRSFENVMVRTLDGLPAMAQSNGLTIERVDPNDEEALRTYTRTAGSGFLPEGAQMPEDFLRVGMIFARLPTADAYVARVDGVIAGAAGCESGEGMCSLFGTSVLPAFRRRGLQQALMLTRLHRAVERGCTWATICSGPGIPTERNAARIGFVMAYSRVVMARPLRQPAAK